MEDMKKENQNNIIEMCMLSKDIVAFNKTN
jgi:hypothetical protein